MSTQPNLLLDRGADIGAMDYDQSPPLVLAVQQASIYPSRSIAEGHQAIIVLLLDRGASMSSVPEGRLCNMVFGVPYFDDSLRNRLCGIEEETSEPLSDVAWSSETPLHRAAYSGLPSEVRELLAQGANVNATATMRPGGAGATPLHAATLNPNASVAKLLLDAGADIDASLSTGLTPLHLTATHGNSDVAVLLLQRGADIEAVGGIDNFTPLHFAAVYYRPGVGNALLDRGANTSATNSQGNTPCQEALKRNRSRAMRYVERLCLNHVSDEQTSTPAPPSTPSGFPWGQDGLTAIEPEALGYLQTINEHDFVFDALVSNHPWLADGIDEDERRFLCLLADIPEPASRLATILAFEPSQDMPECGTRTAESTTATPNPSTQASITVSPFGAPPGDSISVSGTGFPANTPIDEIRVFGNDLVTPSSIQTDGTGSFSIQVLVPPNLPPGQHVIRATVGDNTVQVAFQAFPR